MIFNKKYRVQDVFGQSREIPLNYVERKGIDTVFKESLSFNRHIVVYGSSKQGKTSLRKHNLSEDEYILIHCSNKWDIGHLNAQILKQAGFELNVSTSKTVDGKAKVNASFSLSALLNLGGGAELGSSETKEFKPLELDIYDSNDIIAALESVRFDKYIVLEDFHYLKEETQIDFAFELKAFHENSSFIFIIVGVWLEENRLTLLNGDLAGRIYSIDADSWEVQELGEVISRGEELLNIEFSDEIKESILEWCIGSVFLLQEICLRICTDAGVLETQDRKKEIDLPVDVFDLTKSIINQQTGRYRSFLMAFYHGFQETDLHMHRWLLFPILKSTTQELLNGITYRTMKEMLWENHPKGRDLNLGNLTLALNSTSSLQIKKGIKPNIIDYDQSNLVLNIVDRGFIAWLLFQDKDELLKGCDLPQD